jgi:glycerol kinase
VWKLTEGEVFVTDRTNASRTMLCNIESGEWDDGMLKMLNIPRSMLPDIKSSSEIYGYFECMGATVAISGIAGDQQAALFGQCCFERGSAKNTYGTGCFLLTNTGTEAVESRHGLLTTIIATEKDRPIEYALEGSVFVGGAVVQWLRDELHLINDSRDSEYFAKKAKDSGGVYVVPAFAGLGTPYWDMHARGSIFGLTRGTGANHIIRASLESIAYQTNDVLTSMQADMGTRAIIKLKVDGGASANDLLMQMQADFSDIAVLRSSNAEATATGAAYLAGLAAGFWADRDELISLAPDVREFTPEIDADKRASLLDGWRRAVRACREFSKTEE